MSFKTKKIPEHLIIRDSTWERPKKRGRWILWLLGPLFYFALLAFTIQALADEIDELGGGKLGRGELLFKSDEGHYQAALHLENKVDIDINGIVANVSFEQRFSNQTNEWQSAVYVFPPPETAAISYMQLQIGNRIIKSEIKEKGEAKKIYVEATRAGKKASLVEQSRPWHLAECSASTCIACLGTIFLRN